MKQLKLIAVAAALFVSTSAMALRPPQSDARSRPAGSVIDVILNRDAAVDARRGDKEVRKAAKAQEKRERKQAKELRKLDHEREKSIRKDRRERAKDRREAERARRKDARERERD